MAVASAASAPAWPTVSAGVVSPTASPSSTTAVVSAAAEAETATPTASPTPAADEDRAAPGFARGAVAVTADELNVRAAPGLGAEILTVVPRRTRMTVIDGPVGADGHDWYRVGGEGPTGWVAGDFLDPA